METAMQNNEIIAKNPILISLILSSSIATAVRSTDSIGSPSICKILITISIFLFCLRLSLKFIQNMLFVLCFNGIIVIAQHLHFINKYFFQRQRYYIKNNRFFRFKLFLDFIYLSPCN